MGKLGPQSAPPPQLAGRIGRALLFVHLALSPILFSQSTVEVFEFVKVEWLQLTAVLLVGLGCSSLVGRLAPAISWRAEVDQLIRQSLQSCRDPLVIGVLLFVLSAGISTVFSVSPHASFWGAYESHGGFLTIVSYAILFFATRAYCRDWNDALNSLRAVTIGAAVASFYALVQWLRLDPIAWERVSDLSGYVRPFSTLGHPNHLGAYLVMAIPICGYLGYRAITLRSWWTAGLCLCVVLLDLAVVIATLSRGAWIALVAVAISSAVGLYLIGHRPGLRPVLIAASVLVVTLISFGSLPQTRELRERVVERLHGMVESPGREHIWSAGLEISQAQPITGSGLDTFHLAFAQHRPPAYWDVEWGSTPVKAHNELLHILATQGMLGLAAAILFLVGIGRDGWQAWRLVPEMRSLLVVVLSVIVAFCVQNLVNFTVVGCGSLFITCMALLSRWETLAFPACTPNRSARLTKGITLSPSLRLTTRLVQSGVWALTAVVVVKWILLPIAGDVACQEGIKRRVESPSNALESLERAVAWSPESEQYWSELGRTAHDAALHTTDEFEQHRLLRKARSAFEGALALVPANSYHHANLGCVLADLARAGLSTPAQSYAEFDRALELDPGNAYFYMDAAQRAFSLGDLSHARSYCERGMVIQPRHAPLTAQLSWVALGEKNFEEAIRLLGESLELDWHQVLHGCPEMAARLPTAFYRTARFEESARAALIILDRYPDCVDARAARALALAKLGFHYDSEFEKGILEHCPDQELVRQAYQRLHFSPSKPTN